MEDIKQAYAWQEAIELAKELVAVCEEFRDPEANVLVWHLRQAVADIPAGVAADLQAARPASMDAMVRLATILELVRKVYPAIETAKAEEQFGQLWERLDSRNFHHRQAEEVKVEVAAEDEAKAADETVKEEA